MLAICSCGFPVQDRPEAIDVAVVTVPEVPPTVPDATGLESIRVWMVDDGTLTPVKRLVSSPPLAADAVAALAGGATAEESDSGLRSAIPDASMLTEVVVSRGVATIGLSNDFLDIPAGDQVLAVGQVVHTLTDLRGVGRVQFEIDGEEVAVPLPNGDSAQEPVSRDDFEDLLRD
jgi:spore germination protein GerM